MKYLKYFLESLHFDKPLDWGRYIYYTNSQKPGVNPQDGIDHMNEIYELFYDIADKYNLHRQDSYASFLHIDHSYFIQDDYADAVKSINYLKSVWKDDYHILSSTKVQFEYTLFVQSPDFWMYKDLYAYIRKLKDIGYIAYFYLEPDNKEEHGEDISPSILKGGNTGYGNFEGIARIKIIVE